MFKICKQLNISYELRTASGAVLKIQRAGYGPKGRIWPVGHNSKLNKKIYKITTKARVKWNLPYVFVMFYVYSTTVTQLDMFFLDLI